jgi:hypothetical protein
MTIEEQVKGQPEGSQLIIKPLEEDVSDTAYLVSFTFVRKDSNPGLSVESFTKELAFLITNNVTTKCFVNDLVIRQNPT